MTLSTSLIRVIRVWCNDVVKARNGLLFADASLRNYSLTPARQPNTADLSLQNGSLTSLIHPPVARRLLPARSDSLSVARCLSLFAALRAPAIFRRSVSTSLLILLVTTVLLQVTVLDSCRDGEQGRSRRRREAVADRHAGYPAADERYHWRGAYCH